MKEYTFMTNRHIAMIWWNTMSLEEKFYKTIKYNELIVGDKTRHPNTLTGREIEAIWNADDALYSECDASEIDIY